MRVPRPCLFDLKLSAALSVLVSAVFLMPAFIGWRYFGLDLDRIDLGLTCEVQHLLEADWPLWLSPRLGDGGPLWARPTAQLLYPLRWLGLPLLSADAAVTLHVALHLGLMAGGGALLLRSFGARPDTAAVGGATLALTGTAVDLIGHTSYLVGAAWLPWAWAFCRWLMVPSRRRWGAVGLTVALACMLAGGEPQSFATACGLWLLEVLARVRLRRALWRPVVLGALAIMTALLVVAPVLLPTLVEASLTPRAEGFTTRALTSIGVFRPGGWWALVLPLDLDFDPAALALDVFYGRDTQPWNAHPYLGLAVIGVAAVGLSQRRHRVPLAVVLGGFGLAIGELSPVFEGALTVFPPLGLFRYPAKHVAVVSLALVLVAFVIVDRARAPTGRRRLRVGLALGLVLAGLLAVVAAFSAPLVGQAALPVLPFAALPVVLAGVATLLRVGGHRAVLVAVFLGVAVSTLPLIEVGPRFDDVPPLASRFGARAGARLCVADSSVTFLPGRPDVPWDRAVASHAAALPELGACHGFYSAATYSTLQTSAEVALSLATQDRPAVDVFRVMGCELVQVGDKESVIRVVPVERPMPEAWIVRGPREVPLADTVLEALDDQGLTPSTIDRPLGAAAVDLPSGEGATLVSATWDDPTSIEVNLAGAPAVVGLRTSYRRGWTAEQAGARLPLVRVASTKLAVVVERPEAGAVRLRYGPPRLGVGLALAALGLLTLLALTLGRPRRLFEG